MDLKNEHKYIAVEKDGLWRVFTPNEKGNYKLEEFLHLTVFDFFSDKPDRLKHSLNI